MNKHKEGTAADGTESNQKHQAYNAPKIEVIELEMEGVIAMSLIESNSYMPEQPGEQTKYRGSWGSW